MMSKMKRFVQKVLRIPELPTSQVIGELERLECVVVGFVAKCKRQDEKPKLSLVEKLRM